MALQPVHAKPFPIGNDGTLDPRLTHYCAPKHWDATMIYRYTVPDTKDGTGSVSYPMALDPRPWSKICLQYRNTGPAEPAPCPPSNFVVTGATEFVPNCRYSAAIDNESRLRRLDRPLNEDLLPGPNTCFPEQYVLPANSDALQQYVLLPPQRPSPSKMARELQDPAVLERMGQYRCSEEAMVCNLKGANRFFNNPTKLSKYNQKAAPCGPMLWQTANGRDPSADNLPRPVPLGGAD
jgi:hypothetical protein